VKNPFAPKDDKDAAEFASLHDSLNWVSLQAQVGEVDGKVSTVSSDFVVVTPSLIHVQALADNEPEAKILDCHNFGGWTGKNGLGGHLWKTAREAIDVKHPATHSVPFDAPYVDILPFIETHFTNLGFFMKWTTYDKKMEADMFKQLGLQYNFELVDYEDGVHETGETKHMTMKANYDSQADFGLASVQVTARSVDAQGNTKANEAATREAIDREPLMRVELLAPAADHNGNRKWDAAKNAYVECTDGDYNVIEIGYIKFIITDHFEPTFVNIEMPDYYMNCDDEQEVTWAQVEALILAKIGVNGYTKAQFESEYGIVDDALNVRSLDIPAKSHIDARQWYFESETNDFTTDVNPKDGNPDNVKPGAYLDAHATGGEMGVASYCSWDKANKQTNVLRWMIAGSDAKREAVMMYITGTDNVEDAREILISREGIGLPHHDLITTVKFVKKGVDKKTQEMTAVYVNLIIPGEKVHFAYADANRKDLSHWYKLNSTVAPNDHIDAKEVHMNVPTEDVLSGYNKKSGQPHFDKEGATQTERKDLKYYDFWRNIFENYYANGQYPSYVAQYDCPDLFKVYNADKFDKFAYEDGFYKHVPSFGFVLPKNGVNAENVNVVDGTWTVKGYSSKHGMSEYTLHLDDPVTYGGRTYYKTIRDQHNCVIARIQRDATSGWEIVEMGDGANTYGGGKYDYHCNRTEPCDYCPANEICRCANDILNYAGRYDDDGNELTDYMEEGKYFTAYAEVIPSMDDCYPILIGHRYINFRFERPINVWGLNKLVKDGINVETAVNTLNAYEMLTVADWRKYYVGLNGPSDTPKDVTVSFYNGNPEYKAAALATDKIHFDGESPYQALGLEVIYADVDNILSDHGRKESERMANHELLFKNGNGWSGKGVYTQAQLRDWIADGTINADNIRQVPGFQSSFDYYRATGAWNAVTNNPTTRTNTFAFYNNKDNVQLFHYYIPVYVSYAFGEHIMSLKPTYEAQYGRNSGYVSKPATFKVWVVVTCLNTKNN